jgi:hypothetical protein
VATRHDGDVDLEPLTPIDLDDTEVGIRPEDRYAAIPPGPKLIRRRVHDESSWAPLWLLAGLVVLFVVGAMLGRSDNNSGAEPATRSDAPPRLQRITGDRLLVIGSNGVAEYDVDNRTVRPLDGNQPNDPVIAAARTDAGLVMVDSSGRAVALQGEQTIDLGSADSVVGGAGRAWLLVEDRAGFVAREASVSGAPPREIPLQVPGHVIAAVAATDDGIVAEASESPPDARTTSIWFFPFTTASAPERFARGHELVGASATTIAAVRSASCIDGSCDLVLTDSVTGEERVLPAAFPDQSGTATLSSDGDWLFVQIGNQIEAIDTAIGERFSVGELPDEYPQLGG